MSVDADISTSEDLFGKTVDQLQSNVVVGTNAITGTLLHVTDYTGFSSKTEEQSGNYLVTHSAVPGVDGVTITVEVVGGTSGPSTLGDDGLIVDRITSTTQKIKIVASKPGLQSVTKIFDLSGLTLNAE